MNFIKFSCLVLFFICLISQIKAGAINSESEEKINTSEYDNEDTTTNGIQNIEESFLNRQKKSIDIDYNENITNLLPLSSIDLESLRSMGIDENSVIGYVPIQQLDLQTILVPSNALRFISGEDYSLVDDEENNDEDSTEERGYKKRRRYTKKRYVKRRRTEDDEDRYRKRKRYGSGSKKRRYNRNNNKYSYSSSSYRRRSSNKRRRY